MTDTMQLNAARTAAVFTKTVVTTVEVPVVQPGQFVLGKKYQCVWANPKAKPGSNGQPRFTVGVDYMTVKNASSVTETSGRPPVFLVDNGFACVSVNADAKIKSLFIEVA